MAKDIQRPGIAERLVDFFRLTGSVQLGLEEFVQPTVVVADLAQASVPPIRRHASVQVFVGAVVGELFQAMLRVPPGVIADIQRVSIFSTTVQRLLVGFGSSFAVPPVTLTTAEFTDLRLQADGQAPSTAVLTGTDPAGVVGPRWAINVDNTQSQETTWHPQGWLIGVGESTDPVTGAGIPISTLEFSSDVVNVSNRIILEWDEYLIA